jgi:hypothetical protein
MATNILESAIQEGDIATFEKYYATVEIVDEPTGIESPNTVSLALLLQTAFDQKQYHFFQFMLAHKNTPESLKYLYIASRCTIYPVFFLKKLTDKKVPLYISALCIQCFNLITTTRLEKNFYGKFKNYDAETKKHLLFWKLRVARNLIEYGRRIGDVDLLHHVASKLVKLNHQTIIKMSTTN